MKKWLITIITLATLPVRVHASATVKLPYAKGQSFVVTQGYDTPPTHIKKDSYALDLTQNGCGAYGKAAVAAASGKVMFLSQEGYNGGYGTELIIDHGGNIVSRYAHMIPDSITLAAIGTLVRQGQTVGLIGDTGLVAGMACAAHPGTHIHFAMDTVNDDGTFSAYDPEPISGYTDMMAGKWYLSDNGEEEDTDDATTTAFLAPVNATSDVATTTIIVARPTSSLTPTDGVISAGSVFAVSVSSNTASAPTLTSTPTSTTDATNTIQNTTSTSSDATSTPQDATSTVIASSTSTASSTTTSTNTTTTTEASSTATSSAPATTSSPILFSQLDDSANSPGSFYGDNWFELGNGFAGTLNALTLEGRASDVQYLASQVSLQEFKDKNYSAMIEDFPISADAPFTNIMATTTFSGLSIPLKPYFYYRLATVQDLQNRSVILAGTATTTTGTVMWNNFVYGTGRVEYTAPFFPFMEMLGVVATSTPVPPPLTTPTNLAASFDQLGMQLTITWASSTDPDWPANPLHYEMNYSTSTSLSDAGWTAPGPIPVAVGNSYLIGVRARDNYGAVSAAATATWNFPAGFTQYLLSPSLSYAYQYFTVPSTSTLQSIQLFTTNAQTSARNIEAVWCSVQVFDEYDLSSLGMTPGDNSFYGYDCAGTPTFTFASSPLVLYPSHRYHWVFTMETGNYLTGASVQFYGTAANTAGGLFGDPSLVNARFIVNGDSGVVFSN
ncbi:MAG TPA: M23 family metallopeptidase [Candidatus Paceibacterota bacterium]|nr:M23 family metallopeptidase [Candidatus Paceibacterota bacterium]